MRRSFLFGIAALACAACEPPRDSSPIGAAVVKLPDRPQPMPAAVAATVKRLRDIAAEGGYRDLAKIADLNPDFRSNAAGLRHVDYWNLKMRTGDFPMVHVEKVLSYRFAVQDSEQGRIYVWPWTATLSPSEITPAAARDIETLLGADQVQALREGAAWPGYVLGIREDGQWLYFVSGAR